jgi:diguanylate cyclase (GGDEF)-like protein
VPHSTRRDNAVSWSVGILLALLTVLTQSEVLLRLSLSVCILIGLVRFTPQPRWPYLLLIGSNTVFLVRYFTPSREIVALGLLDSFGALLAFMALARLLRDSRRSSRWARTDIVIATGGLAVLINGFFVEAMVAGGETYLNAVISHVYLLSNALGLLWIGPVVLNARSLGSSQKRLCLGLCAWWLGDIVFALATRQDSDDLLIVSSLAYVAMAGLSLSAFANRELFHLAVKDPGHHHRSGRERVPILVASLLAPLLSVTALGRPSQVQQVLALVGGTVAAVVAARALIGALRNSEAAADNIEVASSTDNVTGHNNRFGLRSTLNRRTTNTGLVVVELIGFGAMNDAVGYVQGDEVLRVIAARLLALPCVTDIGRINGNQFVLTIADRDLAGLMNVATLAQALVETPHDALGHVLRLRAGIGIAEDRSGESADRLLQRAEIALRRGRLRGDAITSYSDETETQVQEGFRLRDGLADVVARDEIVPLYQPVINLRTDEAVAMEALCRWRQSDGSLLTPDRFISIAEETGDIVAIGDHMIDLALGDLKWLIAAGMMPADATVSVNVSARQLHDEHLVRSVEQALAKHNMHGSTLVLEITESLTLEKPASAHAVMDAMRVLGVGIALDDFGTGYSSIDSLLTYPVTEIKIDRSVVTDLHLLPLKRALAASHIRLAEMGGLDLIAEGIETAEEERELRQLGCVHAQGYLFSRPLALRELAMWLGERLTTVASVGMDAPTSAATAANNNA